MRVLFQKDHSVDSEKEKQGVGKSGGRRLVWRLHKSLVLDDEGLYQGKGSMDGGEGVVSSYDISRLGNWVATTSLIKCGKLTIHLSWRPNEKEENEMGHKSTNTRRMRGKVKTSLGR